MKVPTPSLLSVKARTSRVRRRVKTPTILQMEAVECGAAALSIVLASMGRYVPLERLRIECGVCRDGSKASNILKAARKYGLDAQGFKREPEELRQMTLPLIVFWNFNHFVVIEGFLRKWVCLNDPAAGPRKVTYEEFDQSFTGVVISLSKTSMFSKEGQRPSVLKALHNRLGGSHLPLLCLILTTLALAAVNIVIPAFSRVYVDSIMIGGFHRWLRPLLLGMSAVIAVKTLLTVMQQRILIRLETKLAICSSSRAFWRILQLPMEFFAQRYAGEIVGRVESNDRIASLIAGELGTNIVNVLLLGFYAALMLHYDPVLTAIGVSVGFINLLALRFVSRTRRDDNLKLLQLKKKLMGTSTSGLQMIETLKATGSESEFFTQWAGQQARFVNAQQSLGTHTMLLAAAPPLLMGLNAAVVLGVGAARVMDGILSIGMLFAFQILMNGFLDPIQKLVDLGSRVQEAQGDLARVDDVFRYEVDPAVAPAAMPEPSPGCRLQGAIEMRNVTFGYSPAGKPIIEDFSVTLHPGSRTALVGRAGSGKSTIARLVAGLYEPWSGEILFDGVPRKSLPRRVVTSSIGYVDQEIFLFGGPIRQNLCMWDSTVDDSSIAQAAKDACIHGEITSRSGSYDAMLDEGGRNFSGGQRQRLEIARALVSNPRVIILDEATSALDPRLEKQVDDNLRRRGCTCLIVAHRLSTVRDCDEIIVLHHGRIAQRGTHDELIAEKGLYAGLIRSE